MKKYLFLFLLCAGCAAGKFSFTPVYNAQVVQWVQSGEALSDTTYAKMIASTDKSYTQFAPDYLQIENIINSISLADSLRPKAVNVRLITAQLQSHFLKYELDHKTRGTLTNGEFRAYKNDVHAFWNALLIDEESLNK